MLDGSKTREGSGPGRVGPGFVFQFCPNPRAGRVSDLFGPGLVGPGFGCESSALDWVSDLLVHFSKPGFHPGLVQPAQSAWSVASSVSPVSPPRSWSAGLGRVSCFLDPGLAGPGFEGSTSAPARVSDLPVRFPKPGCDLGMASFLQFGARFDENAPGFAGPGRVVPSLQFQSQRRNTWQKSEPKHSRMSFAC